MKKYGFRFVPAGNGFTGKIIDENKNVNLLSKKLKH